MAPAATKPAALVSESAQQQPSAGSFPGLNERQLRRAFKALITFVHGREAQAGLLDEDEFIYLVVALKNTPKEARKNKPIPLPIPHPLYNSEDAEICAFVKDHKGEGHKAAKARLKAQASSGINKVIGLSKLRTKYESHESKRELCKSFDIFLADDRILPSLPSAIGKSFFKKKKQPIPVDLTKSDWARQVALALSRTYMFMTGGSCLNIKVARSSMDVDQCVANAMAALTAATPDIPHKWANIRALHIKTADSAALPVYQALPETLPGDDEQAVEKAVETKVVVDDAPAKTGKKGAKRARVTA